ncbi:MAG: type IV toxin-antitoxin system AbiEi family antitoxin domain-containing protein [Lachnospiraceae bacterium]|nr:type IV toxin-antitoxin system AbiEi family antitoxin domain-containing protein [Lachnospiraceae bacterium]
MDYYVDQLKMLIEQNGGIVSAGDMQKAGIDRVCLYESLKKGILLKESHGNYVLADDQPDEFKIIQSRSDKLIFSHGTALYLHGISDRVPHDLDITVSQGNNVSRIKKCYENTKFHYCKKELWDLGITTLKTPQGYEVKAYDLERCICDLIRDKKNIDTQIYTQAMKEYFGNMCNPRKIIKYARCFKLEQKIRTYMEVLG